MTDTFCALPWLHLSTRPDGAMRVCCTANASSVGATNDKLYGGKQGELRTEDGTPANLNNSDFLSAWNNTYMKNVRKQMMNGKEPPSCHKCFKEERAGHNSKRMWETRYWADYGYTKEKLIAETSVDGEIEPKVRYIDLRMGTKCQLACVMCSPHDSSGWIKEWIDIHDEWTIPELKEINQWHGGGKDEWGATYNWHKDNPVFWEQLYSQIPHMEQLYFAGGESTIIDEHYELLDKVIEMGYNSKIELRYNSNGIELPDRLLELWKQFRKVRFHYSVDAVGKQNDFIRYPSEWSHTEKQFWRLNNDTSNNVEVTVACAVNALNIYYIPDFLKWKLEQGFTKINMWPFGAGGINYHFVYWPAYLNVKALPNNFKELCEKKYEEFYPWWEANWEKGVPIWHKNKVDYDKWRDAGYGIKRLQGMIKFMKSEDWSIRVPQFKQYIDSLAKHRNMPFNEYFPEMYNAIYIDS